MKVAWASNAPWTSTGYGTQTAQVLRHLRDDGHDVAALCNWGLQSNIMDWEGIRCYPSGYDQWSNDVIPSFSYIHFAGKPGWLLTLMDAWVFRSPEFQRMNVASWTPVDHNTCPPRVSNFFHQFGAVPIAMSEFGQRMLAKEGLTPLYAPHGIDTKQYRPKPQAEARGRCGLPQDAYIVGMVANNKGRTPSRKSFPEAFLAFSVYQRTNPDAILCVHAEQSGIAMGLDLIELAEACRIPKDALMFSDQVQLRVGVSDDQMTDLYSSFNVLLAPSRGEGFGIPVVESQACGTPVIVTNATAQTELCGAGWMVDGQPEWDPDQGAWWTTPNIEALVAALQSSESADHNTRIDARQFALRYDHDTVWEQHWRPIIAELEARLPSAEPIEAVPV